MAGSIEMSGTIRRHDGKLLVEIDRGSVGGSEELFDDGQPVRLMIWDARSLAERSDLEQVSEVQQLPKEVVAEGLRARGAIQNKEDFLQRLTSP